MRDKIEGLHILSLTSQNASHLKKHRPAAGRQVHDRNESPSPSYEKQGVLHLSLPVCGPPARSVARQSPHRHRHGRQARSCQVSRPARARHRPFRCQSRASRRARQASARLCKWRKPSLDLLDVLTKHLPRLQISDLVVLRHVLRVTDADCPDAGGALVRLQAAPSQASMKSIADSAEYSPKVFISNPPYPDQGASAERPQEDGSPACRPTQPCRSRPHTTAAGTLRKKAPRS